MEREEILYVPACDQKNAIRMGAIFKRKSFFNKDSISYFVVSDGLDEVKASKLVNAYGIENLEQRRKKSEILSKWNEKLLVGDKFDILRMAKNYGLPTDTSLMEKFFLRLRDVNNDYPVSWEHLRKYVPEFDTDFGVDRYLKLHRDYHLEGDMVTAISQSGMPTIDKYFLYFVYEITE